MHTKGLFTGFFHAWHPFSLIISSTTTTITIEKSSFSGKDAYDITIIISGQYLYSLYITMSIIGKDGILWQQQDNGGSQWTMILSRSSKTRKEKEYGRWVLLVEKESGASRFVLLPFSVHFYIAVIPLYTLHVSPCNSKTRGSLCHERSVLPCLLQRFTNCAAFFLVPAYRLNNQYLPSSFGVNAIHITRIYTKWASTTEISR